MPNLLVQRMRFREPRASSNDQRPWAHIPEQKDPPCSVLEIYACTRTLAPCSLSQHVQVMSATGEHLAAPLSLSSGSSMAERNRGGQSCASHPATILEGSELAAQEHFPNMDRCFPT